MAYDCPDFVADVTELLCKDCICHSEQCDDEDTGLQVLFGCIVHLKEHRDKSHGDDP